MKQLGYILYVDEAGDDGIRTVRPVDPQGASEWMVLAGILVRAANSLKPVEWVREFKSTIKGAQRPDLHFYDLSDPKRLEACRHIATKPLRWFAVASNKRNMRGYRNLRAERWDTRSPFYNWLLRLLLERASAYCTARSIRDYGEMRTMRVELAARGGVSIPRIRVYLYKLRNQSMANRLVVKRGDIAWEVMDSSQIEAFPARKRAGIQLADVVASAVAQAVELKPDGTIDPRFADELRRVVGKDPFGAVADFGLKLMPSPPALWRVGLSAAQISFFESYGYERSYLVSPDP